MQATTWREVDAAAFSGFAAPADGPIARAVALTHEAADAVDALFGPWEAQLEASVRRLSALQTRLDAEARRLMGLESELARLGRSAWVTPAT
jgi:hypothetical protein